VDQKNEALLCAVRTGSVDGVKAAIVEGASANARYANGDRALHHAVANSHVEVVRLLLAADANVHVNDDKALRWATTHGHAEIVSLLLAAGANVHADHDAALRQAAASGHTEIVRLLLSAGANVHVNDDVAILWATADDHAAAPRLLLVAGADPLAAWTSANRDGRQSMLATLEACADAMAVNQRAQLAAASKQFVGLHSAAQTHRVHRGPQR